MPDYDSIRLVVSDFHVVRGSTRPFGEKRFGYQMGGSHVFDTGNMDSLRGNPNYLCSNGMRYRIKIRCKDPTRLQEFQNIFNQYGRKDQIEEAVLVDGELAEDDIDADGLQVFHSGKED